MLPPLTITLSPQRQRIQEVVTWTGNELFVDVRVKRPKRVGIEDGMGGFRDDNL